MKNKVKKFVENTEINKDKILIDGLPDKIMKRQTKILILIMLLLAILVAFLAIYWFNKLQIAHSTFEDYYKFRGCTDLINRTEDSGFCKISSGQIIEIVKYNRKWYLNGDLPSAFPSW